MEQDTFHASLMFEQVESVVRVVESWPGTKNFLKKTSSY